MITPLSRRDARSRSIVRKVNFSHNMETVTDNLARDSVSDLRAGVYLLRVTAADGKEYHRKVVKR